MLASTWEPQHYIMVLGILAAPTLLVILTALIRGYNVMFWRRHDGDDPVFYFGRRKLKEERKDDEQ
jgi:hypothetical protein